MNPLLDGIQLHSAALDLRTERSVHSGYQRRHRRERLSQEELDTGRPVPGVTEAAAPIGRVKRTMIPWRLAAMLILVPGGLDEPQALRGMIAAREALATAKIEYAEVSHARGGRLRNYSAQVAADDVLTWNLGAA